MAVKDIVKVSRKTFLNPRAWLGYDTLKESSRGFAGIMRGVFGRTVPSSGESETFDEAATRFNLTEKNINDLAFTYLSYAVLFFLMALGILTYSIWLLVHLYVHGFLLGFAIVALLGGQTFRFHFLYFQIKHRKLGCTLAEWKSGKIDDKGAD